MRRVLVGAVAGAVASWAVMNAKMESERAEHAQYVSEQISASADVMAALLEREREAIAKLEEVEADAQRIKQDLERQLADSDFVAGRMREKLADLSGRIVSGSAVTAECKTAASTAAVLAKLLGDLDGLAGAFAESADRNRIAGEACERAYGVVRSHAVGR